MNEYFTPRYIYLSHALFTNTCLIEGNNTTFYLNIYYHCLLFNYYY